MTPDERLNQVLRQIETLRVNVMSHTWYASFLIEVIDERGGPLKEDQVLAFCALLKDQIKSMNRELAQMDIVIACLRPSEGA